MKDELKKAQRQLNDYYSVLANIEKLGEQLRPQVGDQEAFEIMRNNLDGETEKLQRKLDENNNQNYLPPYVLGVMIDECKRALEAKTYWELHKAIAEIEIQILTVLYWTDGPMDAADKYLGAND